MKQDDEAKLEAYLIAFCNKNEPQPTHMYIEGKDFWCGRKTKKKIAQIARQRDLFFPKKASQK